MTVIDEATLGEDGALIPLETADDNRRAAAALARQARYSLHLLSPDLEVGVFGDPAFVAGVSAVARHSARSHVHILARDSRQAVQRDHPLIRLAQDLSSYVKIHRIPEDVEDADYTVLVVDQKGYLYRRVSDRMDGVACFHNPPIAWQYVHAFQGIWEQSDEDISLRRLHL
jgi:hypothetical protein